MTVNPRKLHIELTASGLPIESVRSDASIVWATTPTQQQLDEAASKVAIHNPENYIQTLFSLNIDDLITKVEEWRGFFYANRNINFSTMDTATQDLVIKRLMFIAIYILDEFRTLYDDFIEDPP